MLKQPLSPIYYSFFVCLVFFLSTGSRNTMLVNCFHETALSASRVLTVRDETKSGIDATNEPGRAINKRRVIISKENWRAGFFVSPVSALSPLSSSSSSSPRYTPHSFPSAITLTDYLYRPQFICNDNKSRAVFSTIPSSRYRDAQSLLPLTSHRANQRLPL